MSVFSKVVSRVRGFFLEPEIKVPATKPGAAKSPSPEPASKPARPTTDKPDPFNWEPPRTNIGSGDVSVNTRAAQNAFSARNFSTEELQKSSVLDIVAAVESRNKTVPPPQGGFTLDKTIPGPKVTHGLPAELPAELGTTPASAPLGPGPGRSRDRSESSGDTVEVGPLLVGEIPRPPAAKAAGGRTPQAVNWREFKGPRQRPAV